MLITTLVVSFLGCCRLEVRCGQTGVVSGLQAKARQSRNIISPLGPSTEILCSYPLSSCLLLIYFTTRFQRCGSYCVVVTILKYSEGCYLHRCLCQLLSQYLSREIYVKTRTSRQLLGQKLSMGPPEFKIANYSTTIHDLQFN